MRPDRWMLKSFDTWITKRVETALMKYAEVPPGRGEGGFSFSDVEPPYRRRFKPSWIYKIRRNQSLVNNAIEEKVNQTFRRGWGEWEKAYEAKCPECGEEFDSEAPFKEEMDPEGEEIPAEPGEGSEEQIDSEGDEPSAGEAESFEHTTRLGKEEVDSEPSVDFSEPHECPECEEMVKMETPSQEELERAKEFFKHANGRSEHEKHLEPDSLSSVSQSFIGVLREVSTDIQSFDDGWLVYDREYIVDSGRNEVRGWNLKAAYRAPPELCHYSVNPENGDFGGEHWVCLKCRNGENYSAESHPGECSDCGLPLYEVYAYITKEPQTDDIVTYLIRGEFVHDSEYEPSRFTGYSPIVTLFEEARTLEQMDNWYQSAYEHRRAPRGAIAIKSGNRESTIEWNKKQFEKMRQDTQHIPTLMDDGESSGDPISFINLLESPAEMQHMEMREWFLDRISAKWGVTAVFQKASPGESGLSQSMEIQVSNRSADRLRTIVNESFVKPTLDQLGIDGWTVEVAPVEEENEQAEADLMQKHLNLAQLASQLGLEAEWTNDDRVEIKPGDVEAQEGGMGGLGDMMGGMPDDGPGGGDGTGPVPGDGEQINGEENEGGNAEHQTALGGGDSQANAPRRPDDATRRGQ